MKLALTNRLRYALAEAQSSYRLARHRLGRYRHVTSARVVITILLGVLGLIAFQLWASTALSRRALTVSDSIAHRDIARLFASRLSSIAGASKPEVTYKQIRDLAAFNPAVRIYLLDEHGIVKVSPEGYGPVKLPFIDMRALRENVAGAGSEEVLYGDDPIDVRSKNPISVAPVSLGGTPHFVYVVLAGSEPNATHATSATLTVGVMSALFTVLIVMVAGGAILLVMLRRVAGMHSNLTAISHDLRGPLGAVQGYLETLMERGDRLQRSDSLRYMAVALKSTQSAATLVNDLHELSKLESSGETIEKEPFALTDLVMDVVMSLKQRSEEKGVCLEAVSPPQLPLVLGNVQLIERLMRNLAENSLRYTERGGRITVSLHVVAGGVRVLLSDTGCGIPESDLGDVQREFFRGTNVRGATTGSGVGLTIAKKVAMLHGSELKILSREGEGTAVSFELNGATGDCIKKAAGR